jgi:hypothetical protein
MGSGGHRAGSLRERPGLVPVTPQAVADSGEGHGLRHSHLSRADQGWLLAGVAFDRALK